MAPRRRNLLPHGLRTSLFFDIGVCWHLGAGTCCDLDVVATLVPELVVAFWQRILLAFRTCLWQQVTAPRWQLRPTAQVATCSGAKVPTRSAAARNEVASAPAATSYGAEVATTSQRPSCNMFRRRGAMQAHLRQQVTAPRWHLRPTDQAQHVPAPRFQQYPLPQGNKLQAHLRQQVSAPRWQQSPDA